MRRDGACQKRLKPASAKEPMVLRYRRRRIHAQGGSPIFFQSVGFCGVEVFRFGARNAAKQASRCCQLPGARTSGLPGLRRVGLSSRKLAKANIHIPIIFMTGHGDIPMDRQGHEGRERSIS